MSSNQPLSLDHTNWPGDFREVGFGTPKLERQDKNILCSAACYCEITPNVSKDGKNLKQNCVAQRLNELNTVLQGRSPYKPEVSYDMTKTPPAPIMDSQLGDSAHSWIPGWIRKYWDDDPQHPLFRPGQGMIRRPDVVIVNDPGKAPTQDNIKQIVEMKFPPDPPNRNQLRFYARIAGSKNKVATLMSTDCQCDQEAQHTKIPVEELSWAAAVASTLLWIVSKGKTARPKLPSLVY